MSADTAFLGIIALATLTMAVVQIAVLVYAARAVREAGKAMKEMQRSIEPILASAKQMSDDAARITSLAAKQVERVDSIVDGAMGALKSALGLLTTFGRGKGASGPGPGGPDEDGGLFIG
jgi:uncharacterized protein YoxC